MSESDVDDAPEQSSGGGVVKSPKQPFEKLAVALNNDDLQSPGVHKLLLAQISRYEHDLSNCSGDKDKLIEAEKKCAVFEERQKSNTLLEVLYSAGLAVGAALIGIAPSLKELTFFPYIIAAFGAILIVVAVVAKVKTK